MTTQEKITQTIFEVVDEINQMLPPEQQLQKSTETVLVGQESRLDSLGLVNFIVATEQKIEEEFDGATIMLADSMALPEESSPLTTIGRLVNHLSTLLEQEAHA
jgi:acyl carrier protein